MPRRRAAWLLEGFEQRLDEWADMESPSDEVRLIVAAWAISRFDDPYQGMNREPGFANLWYGRIPGTVYKGNVVTCSYWI